MTTTKYEDLKPGDHFISVTQGMRGWFAVEMWINNEKDYTFPEPWYSSHVSYRDRADAVIHAEGIAKDLGLPLFT